MLLLFLAGFLAFVASVVWWGISRRAENRSPISGRDARLANRPAALLVLLGAVQAIAATWVLVYLASFIFAGAAYLGVGPLALPSLLFAAWGIVLGIRLMVRRTALASRSASFWYLPFALFFFVAAFFILPKQAGEGIALLIVACALVAVFALMVVPLLPGVPLKTNKPLLPSDVVH
jgi:hypothetical protein